MRFWLRYRFDGSGLETEYGVFLEDVVNCPYRVWDWVPL